MPFQIVILWTDWLIYLLVAVVVVTVVYVRGREHLLAPWRRVGHSASGMVGLTVLLMFVAVGLLDSLHYRPRLPSSEAASKVVYAAELKSALDAALEPLRSRREKTYSAPLASELFAKVCESCRSFEAMADIHASAEYRQHLAVVLARRALEKAADLADNAPWNRAH